jgi:hypothetical protein
MLMFHYHALVLCCLSTIAILALLRTSAQAQHRPHQPLPVTPIFSVLQHAWGAGCLGLQPQVKLIPSRVERAFSALLGSGFSHSARAHDG